MPFPIAPSPAPMTHALLSFGNNHSEPRLNKSGLQFGIWPLARGVILQKHRSIINILLLQVTCVSALAAFGSKPCFVGVD